MTENKPVSRSTAHPLSARYLAFVGGTGLSTLGDAAWTIALTATLTGLAGPAVVGSVLALAQLPRVVALLGGGAMADRRGAVAVMIGADLLRFGLMAGAALAIAVWPPSIAELVVLAAVLAFLGSFFVPASGALRPQLLPPEHLVRGNALYLVGLRGGQAAGGPAGAWLLGIGGIATVAVANAVSFLASAAAVLFCTRRAEAPVPAKAGPVEPLRLRIAEGLRYVGRSRELTALIVVIGLVELAASGPVNVGLILFANDLGNGATGAGLLLTGFTVGATVAYLVSLVFPVRGLAGPACAAAIAAQGVVLALLGWTASVWFAVLGYAVLGAAGSLGSLVLMSLLQRKTDDAVRGRVMSIMSVLTYGAVPIGSVTIGALFEWLGRGPALALQGSLAIAAVVAFTAVPTLRGAHLD